MSKWKLVPAQNDGCHKGSGSEDPKEGHPRPEKPLAYARAQETPRARRPGARSGPRQTAGRLAETKTKKKQANKDATQYKALEDRRRKVPNPYNSFTSNPERNRREIMTI